MPWWCIWSVKNVLFFTSCMNDMFDAFSSFFFCIFQYFVCYTTSILVCTLFLLVRVLLFICCFISFYCTLIFICTMYYLLLSLCFVDDFVIVHVTWCTLQCWMVPKSFYHSIILVSVIRVCYTSHFSIHYTTLLYVKWERNEQSLASTRYWHNLPLTSDCPVQKLFPWMIFNWCMCVELKCLSCLH